MVNFPVEFSGKKVTPFGGMSLMKRFVDSLGIREKLKELPLPQGGSNRAYNPEQIIESFWLSIWTGASRYIHADWLRYDTVLQDIFGFKSMPSQSTYSRFFNKSSLAKNTEIFPELQAWSMNQVNIERITLDLDSTVITRAGAQRGSAKEYNPLRRGRIHIIQETFNYALKDQKVGLLRADSGFYTQGILNCLESENINYIIATRFYPNVKRVVYGLDHWVSMCKGIEVNQMHFSHEGGEARRYIIVRKEISQRPNAGGKQLFDDPAYRFSCYVTNLDLPLDEIWNMYNARADCENRIKELKADFGLNNFCMQDFWATEASFRFIMVAYNMMSLFRFSALQSGNRMTLSTLRSYCFALGAWTSNHSNRKVLKVSLPVKRRPWMEGIFAKIDKSSPSFQFSNA